MKKRNKKCGEEIAATAVDKNVKVSTRDQVEREFEAAADHGEPEIEQLKNELNELPFMLPSPANSREDATFTNITPDQVGEAFGLEVQRNEPLDAVEKIEERDEDRWALNPASAKDSEK